MSFTPREYEILKDIKECSDGADTQFDLVSLRKLMLMLAQVHYSDSAHYGIYQEQLKCVSYDIDAPEKGELFVKLTNTYDIKTADARPAVYVHVAKTDFTKKVIGNFAGYNEDNSGRYSTKGATTEMFIIAIADSVDIAAALAETGLTFFETLSQMFVDSYGFSAFGAVSVGEGAKEAKAPEGKYRVEAKFSMQWDLQLRLITESHRLKKIQSIVDPI